MRKPVLEVNQLSKNFGGLSAISELDLAINKNELVGIIGPNGAGKTTLFNLISGATKPTNGRVIFEGQEITGLSMNQIAKMGVIRTFQLTTLLMNETVESNVLLGLYLHNGLSLWETFVFSPSYRKKERRSIQRIGEILEYVGLAKHGKMEAGSLPHGHQRILGIAIALAAEPKLLMLDEPVTGLMLEEAYSVMELINKLRNDLDCTILIVEHNMKVVMKICERIVAINFGQKITEGSPSDVANHPEVVQAYLGMRRDVT